MRPVAPWVIPTFLIVMLVAIFFRSLGKVESVAVTWDGGFVFLGWVSGLIFAEWGSSYARIPLWILILPPICALIFTIHRRRRRGKPVEPDKAAN